MEVTFVRGSNLKKGGKVQIKPRDDIHFRLGIMKEAMVKDVDVLSGAFLVYHQLRWYETDGKFGFCVAGYEKIGQPYGFSGKQVENFLNYLQQMGLVEHIWCDKKVYRNKTRIWMSTVRLSGIGTAVDAVRVLRKGKKNRAKLSYSPEQLKRIECIKTTDGSVATTDGSVETIDGSVAYIGEKQGSEIYNEIEKEIDNIDSIRKRKIFEKPSVEEVRVYCLERKNEVDAEAFVDFYESKGWVVGKSPMKNWKAAVRTWERNGYGRQTAKDEKNNLYEPKDGEDVTYQRMFDFWKKYIRVSVVQTTEQVKACKDLLADLGEEGLQRLIIALAMRSKHSFLPAELIKIKDFVGLRQNAVVVQNFYDQHWKYWQQLQKAAQEGKEVWQV